MSALNTAFIDFPFIILLIIAHNVSAIGSPKTIRGKTITKTGTDHSTKAKAPPDSIEVPVA